MTESGGAGVRAGAGRSAAALVAVLGLFLLALPAAAASEAARQADTLTLYLENDLFGFDNKDRYYTHGTKLSWVSRDLTGYREMEGLPPWLHRFMERLPLVNDPEEQRSVSLALGQNIYTPENKTRADLITDDRPYAGITYLGFGLHSKNPRQMDTLELDLGIVGRHAYAEDCQQEIHRWIGSVKPQGWENQLRDEPVVNLHFERKWRWIAPGQAGGLGFDILPHLGVAAGNLLTAVNLGGQVRFGWNLPRDFGTYLIRPGSDSAAPLDAEDPRFNRPLERWGLHLFLAVNGSAVARNLLLDGNTFRESHSVSKRPFVAEVIAGAGLILHRWKVTYSHAYRTREFRGQREPQRFGALALSYSF
jgi:hypothetical protein